MKLYTNVSFVFCIWAVVLLTVFYFSFLFLPHSDLFPHNFLRNLANWDGGHYLGIAERGYSEKFQYAFFPLYPLTIRLINQVTGNYFIAAVLISVVTTFLGLHLLYRLVLIDFDKKIAERTILAFLFFPTSFFLLTAYSEGLFFFLAVAAFYLLRQKKIAWAIMAASLASATRIVGLALVAGILIDIWGREGINRKNWYLVFAPLGFLIYCIYLYQQTGDPFYFITAEDHWQRVLAAPGAGFWETLKSIAGGQVLSSNFNIITDLFFAIFGVGFAIRAFRFLPSPYALYSLLSVGIPLFTSTLTSMPRFLLPVFPIFILLALTKNRYMFLFLQLISIMLLAVFTVLFAASYWVS